MIHTRRIPTPAVTPPLSPLPLVPNLRRAFTSLVCVILLIVSFVIIYLAQTEQVSTSLGCVFWSVPGVAQASKATRT